MCAGPVLSCEVAEETSDLGETLETYRRSPIILGLINNSIKMIL